MELLEGKSGFELQGNYDCSARATLVEWREDKAGRDRCTGLGKMLLLVHRPCASTGELGTPQHPPRYTQEEESG